MFVQGHVVTAEDVRQEMKVEAKVIVPLFWVGVSAVVGFSNGKFEFLSRCLFDRSGACS